MLGDIIPPREAVQLRKFSDRNSLGLDPHTFYNDGDPALRGFSKHDVMVDMGGGPLLGSLAQKVGGTSGGVSGSGQYLLGKAFADVNQSLENTINSMGVDRFQKDVQPFLSGNGAIDMAGLQALIDQKQQDVKEIRQAHDLIDLGLNENDVNTLISLSRKQSANPLQNYELTPDEWKAQFKQDILKKNSKQEKDFDQMAVGEQRKQLYSATKEFPLAQIIAGNKAVQRMLSLEGIDYPVTAENYSVAMKQVAAKRTKEFLAPIFADRKNNTELSDMVDKTFKQRSINVGQVITNAAGKKGVVIGYDASGAPQVAPEGSEKFALFQRANNMRY